MTATWKRSLNIVAIGLMLATSVGCLDVLTVTGPTSVAVGDTVEYVLQIQAGGSPAGYPWSAAIDYEVPAAWTFVSGDFEGTFSGVPVTGTLGSEAWDYGCIGSAAPFGMRRGHVHKVSSDPPSFTPTSGDLGTVRLRFHVDGVADTFNLRFAGRGQGDQEIQCGTSASIDVEVTGGGDPPLYLASLGDSLASGEGAGSYQPSTNEPMFNECRRSDIAWSTASPGGAPYLALDTVLPDLFRPHAFAACSRAVIRDLTEWHPWWYDEPPQFWSAVGADLVTLAIGATDAGLEQARLLCALLDDCATWAPLLPDGIPPTTLGDETLARIHALELDALEQTYTDLRNTWAAGAAVYVLGYPNPTAPTATVSCPFPAELFPGPDYPITGAELAFLEQAHAALNQAVECAALRAGVRFVPTDQEFSGHEDCGGDVPWVNGLAPLAYRFLPLTQPLEWKASLQPNIPGQRAIAGVLQDAVEALGPVALTNPPAVTDPGQLPGYCATATPAEVAAVGELLVAETYDAPCGAAPAYQPGAEVYYDSRYPQFVPDTTVVARLTAAGGAYRLDLPDLTADSSGFVYGSVVLPGDLPTDEIAWLEIAGPSAGGGVLRLAAPLLVVDGAIGDSDGDGVGDLCDNCPDDSNANQLDADGDGLGNTCDPCPVDPENDIDGDGLCENVDPCPYDPLNDPDGNGLCGDVDGVFFYSGFEPGDTSEWSAVAP